MHNLEVFKLHDDLGNAFKKLRICQMLTCDINSNGVNNDPDLSEDSETEDADQKYAILQILEDGGNGIISEEDEGAEYDECFPQQNESTEELPLIRDVDRSKFGGVIKNTESETMEWELEIINA